MPRLGELWERQYEHGLRARLEWDGSVWQVAIIDAAGGMRVRSVSRDALPVTQQFADRLAARQPSGEWRQLR